MKTYTEWKEFDLKLSDEAKLGKFDSFWTKGEYNKKKAKLDINSPEIKKQIAMGIKVEMEHTSDPEIARRICLDHLAEFNSYYTALEKMEAELKKLKGA